jgi:hypothetical protein
MIDGLEIRRFFVEKQYKHKFKAKDYVKKITKKSVLFTTFWEANEELKQILERRKMRYGSIK